MKACDRHARFENSVKPGRYQVVVLDLEASEKEVEKGDHVKLQEDFCPQCFQELMEWRMHSEPDTAYRMPELEVTEQAVMQRDQVPVGGPEPDMEEA